MAKAIIKIEGMSCDHCRMTIEKQLNSIEGVKDATVSLEKKNAEIEYDDTKVNLEQLKKAIEEVGYKPI